MVVSWGKKIHYQVIKVCMIFYGKIEGEVHSYGFIKKGDF